MLAKFQAPSASVSEATEKPRVLIVVELLWSYIVTVFPMLIGT